MNSFSRRRFLLAGAATPLLWTPALARAQALLAMPRATEGPFYPDVMPSDIDSDLVKIDGHVKQAGGEILTFAGRVVDNIGAPIPGATVEIWQADVNGRYIHTGSDWSSGKERDPEFQGYGKYTVKADGAYSFRTIRPVAYTGRCPHIHVKVHDSDGAALTSQIYVADDPHNERDWLFRQLSDKERVASSMHLARPTTGPADWAADFDIVVPWTA
jgi:protocatechuate 3,4-dioxygenase, beta subunit